MTTLIDRIVVPAEREFPPCVEQEIQNWVRAEWSGEMPGPPRILAESNSCFWPPAPGDYEDEEIIKTPVMWDRARIVRAIYDGIPHEEQRVIQAEYTRIREFGNLPEQLRCEKACRLIGITTFYYRLALNGFRRSVMEAFA